MNIGSNCTLTNNSTFNGSLLVTGGGWSQSTAATAGAFTTAAGTYTALSGTNAITNLNIGGTGAVTLNPGTYTITTGSGNGITVPSGATLNFTGTSDGALVTLRSSSPGSSSNNYWYLANASGSTVSANYVDVQDSDATTSVTANNSINSNYNTNWIFRNEHQALGRRTSRRQQLEHCC